MICVVSKPTVNPLQFTNFHKRHSFRAEQPISTNEDSFVKDDNQPQPTKDLNSIEKQIHSPLDVFLTLATFGVFGGVILYTLLHKNSKKLSDKNLNNNFISLNDNIKVPILETCKSINKDLKEMLEIQIKLSNCDKKILEESGMPQACKAFLLSGSPGNGKTFFTKIYAKSMNAEYQEIIVPDLISRWVGATEENMIAVFKKIIKTANKNPDKKYVVALNEIDSILLPVEQLTGHGGSTHFASLRNQRSALLNYLDKIMNETNNVTIIGTTNLTQNSKSLDAASMSRFQNIIEVPYPDSECLYEALKMNLEKIKDKDIFIEKNDESLKKLAEIMAKREFSFRNLENMINTAKSKFLNDKLKDKDTPFQYKYLEDAQKKIQKSDGESETMNKMSK